MHCALFLTITEENKMLKLWNKPASILDFFDFDKAFDFTNSYNCWNNFGLDNKKNDDGSYVFTVDIPGIKEEDINIELLEDNVVSIKGERKTATSSYTVQKSFTVSEDCDLDSIKAELKNGVLTISLAPKQLPAPKEVKKIQ